MDYKPEYRRYLPHFQPAGVTFFITGRLYGSLPQEAIEKLREDKETAFRRIQKECKDESVREEEIRQLHKRHFAKWDQYLDTNTDEPQWLANPAVAIILKNAFHHFDKASYDLAGLVHKIYFRLKSGSTDAWFLVKLSLNSERF